MVQGVGCRVQGAGCRVEVPGLGLRVEGEGMEMTCVALVPDVGRRACQQ